MVAANYDLDADRLRAEVCRLHHELGQRERELGCLYGIGELASGPGTSLGDLLQRAAALVPSSWQYPASAWARITHGGNVTCSRHARETVWRIAEPISSPEGIVGMVEVFYTERKPDMVDGEGPFTRSERRLINAIARQLGDLIRRKSLEHEVGERLGELNYLYRTSDYLCGKLCETLSYAS